MDKVLRLHVTVLSFLQIAPLGFWNQDMMFTGASHKSDFDSNHWLYRMLVRM